MWVGKKKADINDPQITIAVQDVTLQVRNY